MNGNITELLGLDHPIFLAPMAGVSTPRLAAAVSNSGGLGGLGLGSSSVAQAKAMIDETRSLTERPFNLNLFCHRPAVPDPVREGAWLDYLRPHFAAFGATPPLALKEVYRSFPSDPQMLELMLAERPAVISFHFGLPPAEQIRALKQAGIRLLASATTLDEARLIEEAGLDGVIAQGIEAGGHRGVFAPERGDEGIGTLALVRLLVARGRLPVIAAGGIMDGRGIAAVQALGASAAQLGTAFILCPESAANAPYRAALKSEAARHTAITATISGRPAQGLINRFHREVDVPGAPAMPDYPMVYDAAKALHGAASAQGNHDFAAQWAGQGAALAREMPAAELVRVLLEEMRQAG